MGNPPQEGDVVDTLYVPHKLEPSAPLMVHPLNMKEARQEVVTLLGRQAELVYAFHCCPFQCSETTGSGCARYVLYTLFDAYTPP